MIFFEIISIFDIYTAFEACSNGTSLQWNSSVFNLDRILMIFGSCALHIAQWVISMGYTYLFHLNNSASIVASDPSLTMKNMMLCT